MSLYFEDVYIIDKQPIVNATFDDLLAFAIKSYIHLTALQILASLVRIVKSTTSFPLSTTKNNTIKFLVAFIISLMIYDIIIEQSVWNRIA